MLGSPPHTWRILKIKLLLVVPPRITSTYVENTVSSIYPINSLSGSPPHTWRIPKSSGLQALKGRITSTYVENTSHQPLLIWKKQDHLHIRGEYKDQYIGTDNYLGSPPHTWRIPYPAKICSFGFRITSTYVEINLYFNTLDKMTIFIPFNKIRKEW